LSAQRPEIFVLILVPGSFHFHEATQLFFRAVVPETFILVYSSLREIND